MTDNPILNNPYEEPRFYYDTDASGNLDYTRICNGRRPYTSQINITPHTAQERSMFSGSDFEESDPNARFINAIREEVKKWREADYPNTTRVTKELLHFWFCNSERQPEQSLFFCQREAVETAIYLNEVADRDPNKGRALLHELQERRETISLNSDDILPRTAFKMATGTGKTVVMAMLILYNYINKHEYHADTRFADHFLLVAPGITIRDRLSVLYIDERKLHNNYDKNDYYHQRGLIPEQYENILGGLNAAITITNYHQFEPKVFTGKKASPMDGKLVYNKDTRQLEKQSDKEEYFSVLSRLLGRNMRGKRILVVNDEAHHCYLPKSAQKAKDDEERETEEENQKAMVWFEGLRQMRLCGYRVQQVYDLSATPYYLKGSGYPEYSLFPWVVSDFGLVDAIESGLVKIPFLPAIDDSHNLTEPVLRNIYEPIRRELPKKGQKAVRKAAKESGETIVEQPPILPSLLTVALQQFVKDYEDYDRGMREATEAKANLFTTPPVFIVVCNNTTVSREVYRYIAGYETLNEQGEPLYIDGAFPLFSNYKDGIAKSKAPTLLIDSTAIDEAGATISDEFKHTFHTEIEQFKRDYAVLHGAGSADKLTDGDILREVVNTVGKHGMLGHHIRCIVSVSMLTEGWDANTVTHVMGVRAFGSQLLCEQVAGRALRRRSYELQAYDARTGEEIEPQNMRRYKAENITYKFLPEYAHIIGIPFKSFKGGTTPPPRPPKPKTVIRALPPRSQFEITFPNIVGYRSENEQAVIEADYTNVPPFRLDFNQIPTQTTLRTAVGEEQVVLKSEYRNLRDQEIIYNLTRWVIDHKYTDREKGRQFQLFAVLKRIVTLWYESQLQIFGGDGSNELRRLVLFWNQKEVVESIYEGIREANREKSERITAILNYHNPAGSTAYVHGVTSKPVYETFKSHINYVVADTHSWEQIAAKTLEEIPEVECYVKNHFLDFRIPYLLNGKEHQYIPDFIARIVTPKGEAINLIIEISGFSDDIEGSKDAKRQYVSGYWLPAANNLAKYGRWDFIEIDDIDNIKKILKDKIQQL